MSDKNKVKFGLKNVHYAKVTETISETTGAIEVAYATPVRFHGAVSLTLNPQGDKQPFYADDRVYYQDETNNGYEGTLVMAYHTDQVAQDIFGNSLDETTGILVENVEDKVSQIALMYEFDGDSNKVRHVNYNVLLGRPTVASETNAEGKVITTVEYPVTASAAADTGHVKGKAAQEAPAYDTFFDSVTLPGEVLGV